MPIETEKRLIDANLNRLREGIRVVEDIARYILNDFALASSLKTLRHKARICDSAFDSSLLQHRDIKNDILKNSIPSEKKRENLRDIALANFKRSEESARVLEEICKLDSADSASCGADNSPLGLHSADFANLGRFADFSPVSHPKFAKNHESQTENPSVVDSAKSQNLRENQTQIAEPVLDSANQIKSAESSVLCEIFKAIRYELYDIEIAYFKVLEKTEKMGMVE